MGLMRSAWEQLTLVWSTCGFHNGLPPDLRPQTMIEGLRYSLQIMERRPVDLLLVDASTKTPSQSRDPTPRWEQAIGSTSLAKRPLVRLESWKGGVLVWENGPAGRSSKKRWDHLGYTTRVCHLDAQRMGGVLVQPRLIVVHTLKTGEYRDWRWAPTEVGGAPRPMGNLLTPPGLLRTRYLPPSDFDEVTRLTIPHAQIDPMPNKPVAVVNRLCIIHCSCRSASPYLYQRYFLSTGPTSAIKPDTCEFFSAAARILLELGPGNFPGASRGYAFGWTLGKIVNDLRVREFHRGRKKPPHRRFPFSNPSTMPDLERWTIEVHSSMVLMLSIWAVSGKTKLSKAKQMEICEKVHSFYADLVPSCGPLTATHAVSF
jgi:hypothetical protein